MKELLLAIQAELRRELTYIRDKDIFITPHLNYIPAQARPPCVGIKDGAITREPEAADWFETTMLVEFAIYVQLQKDEASIIGDTSAGQKGVLEIAEDIDTALHENYLSISGIDTAVCRSERASQLFGDEKEGLQQKVITFEYHKGESKNWGEEAS